MTTSPAALAYQDAFGLYAKGNLFLALSAVREALERWPDDLPLLRLEAQLLSRAGAYSQAIQACVRLLLRDEKLRGEVFPILGKAYKELWQASGQREALVLARHYYEQSHAEQGAYYPGINAATLSLLCGDEAAARRLARQVLDELGAGGADGDDAHWRQASAGEAELLLGNPSAALCHYRAAAQALSGRYGDLASMRKQVRLLHAHRPVDALLNEVLTLPGIAVFAGHRIDAEERPDGRFPPSREAEVRRRIGEWLDARDIRIGYASAAAGADLLFLESLQEQGRETNIVLPFAAADFIEVSVRPSGEAWVARFEAVLARATHLAYVTPEAYLGDSGLFEQANLVLEGLARLRAQQLDAPLHFLAVCAEAAAPLRPGGTRASLERWRDLGYAPGCIDPFPGIAPPAPPAPETGTPIGQRRSLALLFADIVGYSRLPERELMQEHRRLLARISTRLSRTSPPPLHRNTWGDGLFLAFEDLSAAADFALGLLDDLGQSDAEGGRTLSARISLHFGPAYVFHDSVIERTNVLGTSVNRAARIEPVTPPGEVYLSQEAAALLIATASRPFHLEYVGQISLPKGFGSSELFKLQRRSPGNFDR